MIPVMMAVDHVLHGHLETVRQLALEPRRELSADRLDQHDAVGRHHEHREVVVHARVVDVTRELPDLLSLVLRLLVDRARLCAGADASAVNTSVAASADMPHAPLHYHSFTWLI